MLFEEIINDVHKVVGMGCYVTRTVQLWCLEARAVDHDEWILLLHHC